MIRYNAKLAGAAPILVLHIVGMFVAYA